MSNIETVTLRTDLHHLVLFVPGKPFSKQSFRYAKIENYVHKYQPKKIVQAQDQLAKFIYDQLPDDFEIWSGPVIVEFLEYIFYPLKSFSKKKLESIKNNDRIHYKSTQPDLIDNLNKGIFDAMEGLVYVNDGQVCQMGMTRKRYGMKPGIKIILQHITEGG